MNTKVTSWLQKRIDSNISVLSAKIEFLKKIKGGLTNDDDLRFQISIHSAWHNEGEPNLPSTIFREPLKEAIRSARKKFMKMNNRTDVQGDVNVGIYINKETQFCLSNKDIRELTRKDN